MSTEEAFIRELAELDGLLAESVLLSSASKEILTDCARTTGSMEARAELRRILLQQKTFIVSYLKAGLKTDSLKTDTATLVHEMWLEYQAYLRLEEEQFRKSEILAVMERLELADFPV